MLAIRFLGGFAVTLDDQPLRHFHSNRVRALLAYLAAEPDRPHSRDSLAALLWDDDATETARTNLRVAISKLNNQFNRCPAFVFTHQHLAFDSSQASVDAITFAKESRAFLALLPAEQALRLDPLAQTLELYQGEFLAGFGLDGAAAFDEWRTVQQERLHHLAMQGLDLLQDHLLQRADFAGVIRFAQRQVALEPWYEAAHRRMIEAYAGQGNRAAALAQYESCCLVLKKELNGEPLAETQALAARIRTQQPARNGQRAADRSPDRHQLTVPFVGRNREVEALVKAYQRAGREGLQVVTLLGEAGIGKSRLAQNFLEWATTQGADVLRSRAFETSGGLSYQPITQLLRQRLEHENAPDDLLSDLWLTQLARILPELRDRYSDLPEPSQEEATARQHLFEAITRCVLGLAERAPLVIFIDDWHWADAASLDVLHYAARRWSEEGSPRVAPPILVLLALRQEALTVSPDLQSWLMRLKHDVACVQLTLANLSKAETGQLLRLLLEPQQGIDGNSDVSGTSVETLSLLTRFSHWLFAETAGQPLFLVEILKTLVEDGWLRPEPAAARWQVDRSKFDEQVLRSRSAALQGVREISRGWLGYNLPLQLTSFIGREKEIADIKGLLDSARVVTLTGSGGTGKTRLCQEAGAQLLMEFRHGVWFIELAPLSDAAQLIPALARLFGLQEAPFNPLANRVLDYLRDKKLLLILDNCEHLIEACARLADDLLHQCAGLKILASSREALGIAGEMVYCVPPLMDSESTQLFVERARAAHSNFKLTDANVAAIAQICHRLDNIPLALELAAARVKLLTPEQLASRLDDRFRLLTSGSRTALPRHQTLRAMLDWSYNLLSAEEKRLLQFASVFVGGWTLDALEAIVDDPNTVELLEQIVNKSLVVTKERENENRYFLLETIKQYAREKLLDAQQISAVRDRHFVYFDQLAETMWEIFRSDAADAESFLTMVNRVEDEAENLRAALEWGLENHVEENVRLAANFCIVSMLLGILAEGVRLAKVAVERARTLPSSAGDADIRRQRLIAQALFAQGLTGMGVGNVPVVKQDLKEAITLSRVTGDKRILGYSLELYFTASTLLYEPDGLAAAQEGLKIFSQEVNDKFGLVMAYINMARIAISKGDEDEKHVYLGKLKEIMGGKAVYWLLILFHSMMGFDESIRGNYQTAKKIFEDSLVMAKGWYSFQARMVCMSEIGHIERHIGDLPQARKLYHETIKGWQKLGNRSAIANQLECYAYITLAEEKPHSATKLLGAAAALREKAQEPMADYEHAEYDQSVARLRSMLPIAEFNTLWAEGRAMAIDQAIQCAVES